MRQAPGAHAGLAAVVAVEEDAPVLHVLECRAPPCPNPAPGAGAGGAADVRAFRLETVEDAMALPSALQLPHPPGLRRAALAVQSIVSGRSLGLWSRAAFSAEGAIRLLVLVAASITSCSLAWLSYP